MNEESQSLFEKLEEINEIKHKIKQALIDIGGNGYIDDDTLFRIYPSVIKNIHSDLVDICSVMYLLLNGGDTAPEEKDLTSVDVLSYANDFMQEKQKIVDYLNTCGVAATLQDSFDDLIAKLPQVEDALRERYLSQRY